MSERKNGTQLMLKSAHLAPSFALANELFAYVVYYNNHRPHQALAGQTPKMFAETKTTAIQSAN